MSDSTPEYPVHEGSEEPPVTSPAIGHDEWVARHVERRLPPKLGPVRGAAAVRPLVGLADPVPRRRLPAPRVLEQPVRPLRRLHHRPLHAARARAERRRRLGRPARSRLRRLLRDRRVRVCAAQLRPLRDPHVVGPLDPDRRDHRRTRRPAARAAVETVIRGLPRDRHALLPPALPDTHDERRPVPVRRRERDRRSERNPSHRPPRPLRQGAGHRARRRFRRRLLLRRARLLRSGVRRASLRQPLPHRARVALATRGRPCRRGDGHAGELAEADELLLRGGDRGADRNVVRVGERQPCSRSSSTSCS